jgi:hypothetical protein
MTAVLGTGGLGLGLAVVLTNEFEFWSSTKRRKSWDYCGH